MNWRLASRLSVVTLAILVVILVTILGTHTGGSASSGNSTTTANPSAFQGTDLGGTPAPDFRLTDQFGKSVSLSQFKGMPVIVTFLYTHCPDQCPLTAEKLHTTMLNLGSAAQRVAVLAVSTDPKGDTLASAITFSKAHQMNSYWHFLIGTQSQLSPIWTSYSVYAAPETPTAAGSVSHSIAIFVIDQHGNERVYLGNDFTPAQLTADLQVLLRG